MQGMNGQTFSENPNKRGQSRHCPIFKIYFATISEHAFLNMILLALNPQKNP